MYASIELFTAPPVSLSASQYLSLSHSIFLSLSLSLTPDFSQSLLPYPTLSLLILHLSLFSSPFSFFFAFLFFLQPIFIIGKRISDIKGYYFTLLDEKESLSITPILETLLARRSASGIAPVPQKVSKILYSLYVQRERERERERERQRQTVRES